MSMASRVALFAALVLGALGSAGVDARTPVAGTAMFVVHDDARACPGPRCGGYLVALANGARTRCVDGSSRTRCRAALALDRHGERLGRLPGGSLVRAVLPAGRDDLGELRVHALYLPTGTAPASGGFYRVLDNGIRCVRAPCFSLTARSVNASTRITVSSIDVRSARASRVEPDAPRLP